jgi:hypothetical protein
MLSIVVLILANIGSNQYATKKKKKISSLLQVFNRTDGMEVHLNRNLGRVRQNVGTEQRSKWGNE